MRVPSLNKAACPAGVIILCCVMLGSASADVGGGKGIPSTPYGRSGAENVQDVEKAKAAAAEYQTLEYPGEFTADDTWRGTVKADRVSLRGAEELREGDTVGYALVGKSGSGETLSLSFSEIESFTVTARNKKTITLSVTVWPDIAPEELWRKQPSYKQLKAGYRRNVALEMGIRSADGRPLALGDSRPKHGPPPLLMEKLNVGTKIDFLGHGYTNYGQRYWWAIPSVADDADYPYRYRLMSRENKDASSVVARGSFR